MLEANHRERPANNSCASNKRKLRSKRDQFRHDIHHTKGRKIAGRKTETLTIIKSETCRTLAASNPFEPIRCISRSTKRKKRERKEDSSVVEGDREWVSSSRNASFFKDRIVVVSYNILGVANASNHQDLYCQIPHKFLEWDRRKHMISKEITRYDASILCFQEVDRFKDLVHLLQKDGFVGIHKGRTGEASDGCAIFWKEKMFTLLHEENIEFRSFGLRDNVAQFCVLKMNQKPPRSKSRLQKPEDTSNQSRSILIGNIHVLFNPSRGDIKLGQVRLFLEKAYQLSQEWGSIPVIIAGDLNSIPQSAMYQFLASSNLDVEDYDRRKVSGQLEFSSRHSDLHPRNEKSGRTIPRPSMHRWNDEELRLATGSATATHVRHKLKLFSAYHGVQGSSRTRDGYGEPLATSYHSKFMGTVDYIWHTDDLVPLRVLETVPIDILRRSGGLPNENWGSDHLALVSELAFADYGEDDIVGVE